MSTLTCGEKWHLCHCHQILLVVVVVGDLAVVGVLLVEDLVVVVEVLVAHLHVVVASSCFPVFLAGRASIFLLLEETSPSTCRMQYTAGWGLFDWCL